MKAKYVICGLFLLGVAGIGVPYVVIVSQASSRLNTALVKARQAGVPIDEATFRTRLPDSKGRNAGDYLAEMKAVKVPKSSLKSGEAESLASMRADTAASQDLIALGRKVAACDYLSIETNWKEPTLALFPQYATEKQMVKALARHAAVCGADGDLAGFTADMTRAAKIANFAEPDPTLIGKLVTIAMHAIVNRYCLVAVGLRPDDKELVVSAARIVAGMGLDVHMGDAMWGEAYTQIVTSIHPPTRPATDANDDPASDPLFKGNGADLIPGLKENMAASAVEFWTRHAATLSGPTVPADERASLEADWKAIIDRVERSPLQHADELILAIMGSAMAQCLTAGDKAIVDSQMHLSFFAAISYHQDHGKWPAALADMDPQSKTVLLPFEYKTAGDEVSMLYMVPPSEDGKKPTPHGFRYTWGKMPLYNKKAFPELSPPD